MRPWAREAMTKNNDIVLPKAVFQPNFSVLYLPKYKTIKVVAARRGIIVHNMS
ncbi:MAG: hypothetical protein AABX47_10130 [Nanoarchaeota archaeon]